jgi:hypothetical protein
VSVIPIIFLVLLVVGGAIAMSVAIAAAAKKTEQLRTQSLHQVASDLEFEFQPDGDRSFVNALGKLYLFNQGHSRRLSNLMRGRLNDLEVAIFDYRYVTGHGKHRRVWNHSVIAFGFQGVMLPGFSLRPENVWHKIGAWFGMQDINFQGHPNFSANHLLRGEDESAVRALFTDGVLRFYEQRPEISTEGLGDRLIYYRHGERVDPQRVGAFMEDGLQILSLFYTSRRSDGTGTAS